MSFNYWWQIVLHVWQLTQLISTIYPYHVRVNSLSVRLLSPSQWSHTPSGAASEWHGTPIDVILEECQTVESNVLCLSILKSWQVPSKESTDHSDLKLISCYHVSYDLALQVGDIPWFPPGIPLIVLPVARLGHDGNEGSRHVTPPTAPRGPPVTALCPAGRCRSHAAVLTAAAPSEAKTTRKNVGKPRGN